MAEVTEQSGAVEESADRVSHKTTNKVAVGFTIIESDREMLVDAANQLVETLLMKEIAPACHAQYNTPLEKTPEEHEALAAALKFLSKQFKSGAKKTQRLASSRSVEEVHELTE